MFPVFAEDRPEFGVIGWTCDSCKCFTEFVTARSRAMSIGVEPRAEAVGTAVDLELLAVDVGPVALFRDSTESPHTSAEPAHVHA